MHSKTMKTKDVNIVQNTTILMTIFLLLLSGCKSSGKVDSTPFEYRFEKTHEKPEKEKTDKRTITIVLDEVPFGQAMGILSQETGVTIVWSQTLDVLTASGSFDAVPIAVALGTLARRVNANLVEIGGVWYVGDFRKEDRAFAVLRLPPVDRTQIQDAIKQASSQEGVVSVVGSFVWICDNPDNLRKIVSAVETIRTKSERSYVAEVYFIRVNEDHFVKLTADLEFKQIDIFASSFNIEELFSMFVDGDAGSGWSKISQRPVLYLSEGHSVTISDGDEITREKKTLTETGAVETTGYQKFSDGLELTMLLKSASDKSYAVDMDLSISIFDKADKSTIPTMKRSLLKAESLLVRDSQVYYVGSLRRDSRTNKGGLFSFDFIKSHDMITIWLRVRELKSSSL